jgi:hypothetical protein
MDRMELKELSAPLNNDLIITKLGPEVCSSLGLTLSMVKTADPATEFEFEEEGNVGQYTFEN